MDITKHHDAILSASSSMMRKDAPIELEIVDYETRMVVANIIIEPERLMRALMGRGDQACLVRAYPKAADYITKPATPGETAIKA